MSNVTTLDLAIVQQLGVDRRSWLNQNTNNAVLILGSLVVFNKDVVVVVEDRGLSVGLYLAKRKARAVEDGVVGIDHLLSSRQAVNVPVDIVVLQDASIDKFGIARLEGLLAAYSLARLILAHV